MLLEICLFLVLALLIWSYVTRLPSNYPSTPPIRLPIIGHALHMFGYKNTQKVMNKICDKYGKDGMVAVNFGCYAMFGRYPDIVIFN